ncbi:MAG: cytochrome c oxidase subunit CcoM [Venatoribacter sp.]
MDEVVFAGVLIVGLCVVFLGGFVYAIKHDIKKRGG